MLLARSELQRAAIRKLESYAENDPRMNGDPSSVRAALVAAFGDGELADQCIQHADDAWDPSSSVNRLVPRKELEADLDALENVTKATRQEAGEPPFPDWRASRAKAFELLDEELGGLLIQLKAEQDRRRLEAEARDNDDDSLP
jgi:hypothetical protein